MKKRPFHKPVILHYSGDIEYPEEKLIIKLEESKHGHKELVYYHKGEKSFTLGPGGFTINRKI